MVLEDKLLRQPDLDELEGFLWRREGAHLCWLATFVPANQCIVEVGTFKGKSACYLARGSQIAGRGVLVHCVDLWDLGGQSMFLPDGAPNSPRGSDTREAWGMFQRQIDKAGVRPLIRWHRGASAAVAASWEGPKVGLLFIDGDHTHAGCLSDIRAWEPHLAPGAVVAFHDYALGLKGRRRFPGVEQAVTEWLAQLERRNVPVKTGRVCSIKTVRLPR